MRFLATLLAFLTVSFVITITDYNNRIKNVKTICSPIKDRVNNCLENLPPFNGYYDGKVDVCLEIMQKWDECANFLLYKSKF